MKSGVEPNIDCACKAESIKIKKLNLDENNNMTNCSYDVMIHSKGEKESVSYTKMQKFID